MDRLKAMIIEAAIRHGTPLDDRRLDELLGCLLEINTKIAEALDRAGVEFSEFELSAMTGAFFLQVDAAVSGDVGLDHVDLATGAESRQGTSELGGVD
jgi:hypothetical protein